MFKLFDTIDDLKSEGMGNNQSRMVKKPIEPLVAYNNRKFIGAQFIKKV